MRCLLLLLTLLLPPLTPLALSHGSVSPAESPQRREQETRESELSCPPEPHLLAPQRWRVEGSGRCQQWPAAMSKEPSGARRLPCLATSSRARGRRSPKPAPSSAAPCPHHAAGRHQVPGCWLWVRAVAQQQWLRRATAAPHCRAFFLWWPHTCPVPSKEPC